MTKRIIRDYMVLKQSLNGQATANLQYDFELIGPLVDPTSTYPDGQAVPVLVTATSAVFSGTGNGGGATSSFLVEAGPGGHAKGVSPQLSESASAATGPDSFSINQDFYVTPDAVLNSVTINAGVGGVRAGDASAYVDPTFEVDPSFPNASEYSVLVSPQLVPEPSCICLLAVSAIGLLRRQRRIAL